MSFRRRLIGVVSAVTLLALGGAFAAVFVAVTRSQELQLDQALLGEAHEEAREAAAAGGERLMISDRPGPAANDVGPLTKYAAIYGPGDVVLAQTPSFGGTPPALASLGRRTERCFDLFAGGEHLRGVLTVVPGRPDHLLLLAAPRADLDGDEVFLARAMILAFILAALWTVLASSWVIRKLTAAHERIAAVARRVSAGDLEARVGQRAGDAETAQLARDIDDMIGRIAALLGAQREFIAYAAHELRSPITTLYGELSHALRRPRDADGYRQAIAEALESSRALKQLAEDLLTLARIDAEADEARERAALGALVDAAVRPLAAEARARNVRIEIVGDGGEVACRSADVARLVRNLVENAVRHAPASTAVTVGVSATGEAAIITVADEGAGVPEEERERIFEPFYRGARARRDQPPGAGLGLAIAREIARAHGGDVTLAAAARGAQFVVRLPVA